MLERTQPFLEFSFTVPQSALLSASVGRCRRSKIPSAHLTDRTSCPWHLQAKHATQQGSSGLPTPSRLTNQLDHSLSTRAALVLRELCPGSPSAELKVARGAEGSAAIRTTSRNDCYRELLSATTWSGCRSFVVFAGAWRRLPWVFCSVFKEGRKPTAFESSK